MSETASLARGASSGTICHCGELTAAYTSGGGRRWVSYSGLKERKVGAKREMAQGTVKWFSGEKGYGFITPDDGEEDIFVHFSGIEGTGFRTLKEGDRVSYEPTRGRRGEQAEKVRKV